MGIVGLMCCPRLPHCFQNLRTGCRMGQVIYPYLHRCTFDRVHTGIFYIIQTI
jgi:hypothetical protein